VTCLVWITRKDDVQETLCAGTGMGCIILWRQRADKTTEFDKVWSRRIGSGQEIMTLTCETFEGNPRIITATCDRRVQLWSLDSKYHQSNIFSVEVAPTVPWALCFCGEDVVIFGMYDREM
jgi:WD40 repeat protein